MKSFLILFVILVSAHSFGQLNYKTMTLNLENREYYEYIPTNYDEAEAVPLMIMLHGLGGQALTYAGYGMNDIADTARFIPVYLQGALNTFNQPSWNNGTLLNSTTDDLLFISSVIDSMHEAYNIDRRRVYIVGVSMGAIMTFKAVRHLSDRIAGTVCHIGTMSNDEIANSNPAFPVPTLQTHGTADAVVPYAGTPLPSLSLVEPTITKLKSINGWNGTDSTIIDIPDNQADGITIERIIYDCTTPLEHWKMNGADHIFLFENTNDTSGILVTWNFLRQFTHPDISLSTPEYQSALSPIIYPNPTNGQINIEGIEGQATVSVFNLNQQLLVEQELNSQVFDISHLAKGIYLLKIVNTQGQHFEQLITKQ